MIIRFEPASAETILERERIILAAMDRDNRIKRLEWLLTGELPDERTRAFFIDMLAHERKQAKRGV